MRKESENKFENQNNFDKNFSAFRDYESTLNISEIEDKLIEDICIDLVEDIFNAAVVNW